jgi:hypothetical protein
MRVKVVEYFGLPASGKSWQLLNNGYCRASNAVPHTVPLGGGKQKVLNTVRGILYNWSLSSVLLKIALNTFFNRKSNFLLRPFLVIPERYGRILALGNESGSEIHVDEGVFQFIWRIFSEQEESSNNLMLLEKCISCLNLNEHYIAYICCPKEKHISQVIERNKTSSNFDAGVVKGDNRTYHLGRYWMAQVLKIARRNKFEIEFILN